MRSERAEVGQRKRLLLLLQLVPRQVIKGHGAALDVAELGLLLVGLLCNGVNAGLFLPFLRFFAFGCFAGARTNLGAAGLGLGLGTNYGGSFKKNTISPKV